MDEHIKQERFLRISEVCNRTGLGRSTIYNYINLGKFPEPIKLSDKARAWLDSDIEKWMQSRIRVTKEFF